MTTRIIASLALLAAAAFLAGGCGSSQTTEVPGVTAPDTLFTDLSFGDDTTFDVVTWNIENFTNADYDDVAERERYVIDALRAMSADVVALQEIRSQASFDRILAALPGWDGYRSNPGSTWQQLAFLWNTATVTPTATPYTIYDSDWKNFPRRPLILECTFEGQSLLLVNNHLKCCGNNVIEPEDVDDSGLQDDEEQRRLNAVVKLEEWIRVDHPDDAVILLGDLNDKLTDAPAANVFNAFLDAPEAYAFADMPLAVGSSLYWSYSYSSHIDHIMLTDELFAAGEAPEAEVLTLRLSDYLQSGLSEYLTNMSDHLPVGLKLPLAP